MGQLACLRTVQSHIMNMVTGVTKGYLYKMRMAYAHFPITIEFEGTEDAQIVLIKNFLGQRLNHALKVPKGVTLSSPATSRTSWRSLATMWTMCPALLLCCTAAPRCCARIRKFLDGIYVSEKGPIGELAAI